jgi:hypothetical protein
MNVKCLKCGSLFELTACCPSCGFRQYADWEIPVDLSKYCEDCGNELDPLDDCKCQSCIEKEIENA